MSKDATGVGIKNAVQWFKNGDHPEDGEGRFASGEFKGEKYEGKVVRYFRHPCVDGGDICAKCSYTFHNHGWIDNGLSGLMVCPGDWIVKDETGKYFNISKEKYQNENPPASVG